MIWLERLGLAPLAAGQGGLLPTGTRVDVFNSIFGVFFALGTVVGIIVISYMLYNAYKFRDGGTAKTKPEEERPTLGELPSGGGGGRKLFLSFGLSTIIVVSLIIWTYGTLLYVEQGDPLQDEDAIDIEVVGYQFGWEFVYPNGESVDGTLRVPEDTTIRLTVTSRDVFHNFGVPDLRVKTDAIPGQTTETWFIGDEAGKTYTAKCYELCGPGHSYMTADIVVMDQESYDEWYADMGSDEGTA